MAAGRPTHERAREESRWHQCFDACCRPGFKLLGQLSRQECPARQRTSRLWMPRNGNRLKQRTSGSEAEERTPADAVLRRQQDESLCFDASKNRCASMPARSGKRDCSRDSYNDLCVARAMEKRGQFPGEFADLTPDRAYLSRADRASTPVPSDARTVLRCRSPPITFGLRCVDGKRRHASTRSGS